MNRNLRRQLVLLLVIVVLAGLFAIVQPTAADDAVMQADTDHVQKLGHGWKWWRPRILSPRRAWYGGTYEEWGGKFWQWAYSLPDDEFHPLIADGDMDCSPGQKGKVWFLGGNLYGSEANRSCEVPVGKALFFPLVNIACSAWTGDDDPLACAESPSVPPGSEFIMNPMSLKIDGKKVGGLHRFLVVSQETFELETPDPPAVAIWGAPSGATTPGATRGYYILLAPLSKGEHTIEFAGEIIVTDPVDPNNPPIYHYVNEISYELQVGK